MDRSKLAAIHEQLWEMTQDHSTWCECEVCQMRVLAFRSAYQSDEKETWTVEEILAREG